MRSCIRYGHGDPQESWPYARKFCCKAYGHGISLDLNAGGVAEISLLFLFMAVDCAATLCFLDLLLLLLLLLPLLLLLTDRR